MREYDQQTGQTGMLLLIDALSAHVAITDGDGTIIATNRAWDQFAGDNGVDQYQSYGVGFNYFDICLNAAKNGDDYALQAMIGLKDVLRGRKEEFSLEYPCHSEDEQRWFRLRATRTADTENGLIIAHENTTAQQLAEYKLRESEEKYRLQFEHSMECIIIATPRGNILDANPMAVRTLGYSLEELQAIGLDCLIDPKHPQIREMLEQSGGDGYILEELNYRRPDGAQLTLSLSSKTYRNSSGQERTIFLFRDISRQKLIEKKLYQEQLLSKAILDNLPGTFCLIDEKGYAVQWNKNLENVLGYNSEEIGSQHTINFISKKDHGKLALALEEVFKKGESIAELDLCTKDGRTLPFYCVGVKFIIEDRPFLIAIGLSLEDQTALESELNLNRALFNQLFDNSPNGIALISESLEIQMINKGFTNLFGYSETEALQKDLVDLIVPEELQDNVRQNAIHAFIDKSYHVETERVSKSGDQIPVMVTGIPIVSESNERAAFVVFVDISERVQLEEARKMLLENERAARIQAELDLQQLESIFHNAPVASCMLQEPDHILAYANEAFKALFEKDLKVDKPITDSLPGIYKQGFFTPLDVVQQTGQPYFGQEEKLLVHIGEDKQIEHYLTFVYRPFLKNNGEVAAILIQALDVTEQVLNRNKIQETLKQKEILLHEVHHRVKNNLALITSLLDLQVTDAENTLAASQLKQTQMRIHSIARIHELLYKHDNLVRIPFHDYLRSLISRVEESYPEKKSHIEIKSTINPIEMNVNQAIPCGLLTNEIMNHIYKYSMVGNKHGYLIVNIRERGDKIHMHFTLDRVVLTKEMHMDKDQSLNEYYKDACQSVEWQDQYSSPTTI